MFYRISFSFSLKLVNIGDACNTFLFLSLGPPIIDIPPVDQYVLSGANVSFYCVGYGDPKPSLTWKKNGETVQETDRIKIDKLSGELRIISASVEDAGTYECVYSNNLGKDKRSVVFNVDGQSGTGGMYSFISV